MSLHTRSVDRMDGRYNLDCGLHALPHGHLQFHLDGGQPGWVAERNPFWRPLRSGDARQTSNPQNIAFRSIPSRDRVRGRLLHQHAPGRDRDAVGLGLFGDPHHVGITPAIEMREVSPHVQGAPKSNRTRTVEVSPGLMLSGRSMHCTFEVLCARVVSR